MAKQAIPAIDLRPGMVYVTHYGDRTITRAGIEREHGKDWFMWRWDRAPRADGIDCGYGGVVLSEAATEMVVVHASAVPA